MKLLLIHTHYQKLGGEDIVFSQEAELLQRQGHELKKLTFSNCDLNHFSKWRQATITIWNRNAYYRVREIIRTFIPDIVHVHNTFPLASPAIIDAIKDEGVPLVMTLHNFRLMCLNGLLFRERRVCEDCVGRLPVPGVIHRCYRGRSGSSVVAIMLMLHRLLGTWKKIDCYVALSQFAREKFIQSGISANKIVVKPNFLYPDPGAGKGEGRYAIFVGRLSVEKGVRTLLDAWVQLDNIPLKIIGEGPLEEELERNTIQSMNVEWLGQRPRNEVLELIGGASFLVFSSELYENFPMVLVEAFAKGTPVIAANIGSTAEIVESNRTGLFFNRGDASDLAKKVRWAWEHVDRLETMRRLARLEFEKKYSAEINYHILLRVYQKAMGQ